MKRRKKVTEIPNNLFKSRFFRFDVNEAIAGGISDVRNTRIFNMFALINVANRDDNVANPDGNVANRDDNVANPDGNVANRADNVANRDDNVANPDDNVANHRGDQNISKDVLNFISDNPTANTGEISRALGVSIRTVQRAVKELEEENLVVKTGTRKCVSWTVLKK